MTPLAIATLRTTMLVPGEHPDPERARADVSSAIVAHLRSALARQVPADAGGGAGYWLVRRLEIDADVNAAWDADQIAGTVAASLVRSLARELVGSGDGVNTLRFGSRAAHLGQYLVDRLDGAADRWFYRRFDGLRLLPTATALVTAICAAPDEGLAAMRTLRPDVCRRVTVALTRTGARRVLDAFAQLPSRRDTTACVTRILEMWPAPAAASGAATNDALTLFVHAANDDYGGAALVAAVDLVSGVFSAIEPLAPDIRAAVAAALAAGHLAAALRLAPALAVTFSAGADVAAVARVLAERSSAADEPVTSECLWTRFGGAFLLLPDLDVNAHRHMQLCVVDDEAANLRCRAVMTLARCLDDAAPGRLTTDGVLRDVFGIPPATAFDAAWHAASDVARREIADAAGETLTRFAQRLPGFTASQPDYLRRNFLDVRAAIEQQPGRFVVRLERPPLHMVLGLAGLIRRRSDVPWLTTVPIETFPAE